MRLFLLLCLGLGSWMPALAAPPVEISAGTILTPPAPETPRVNGPGVFGVRPGSVFLYSIPATGRRPMHFGVDRLPAGLTVDESTGEITGTAPAPGEYKVTLRAENALGKSEKPFRIVAGNQLALTPPMGWNSWNAWGSKVSQEIVLASARAMADSGLKAHGWTYINIDDGWQGLRGGPFNAIQPNAKFPDMPGLSRQVHGMGLKLGIYSTPWRGAYSGHIGSSCDNADGTYDWIKSGDYQEFYLYPKQRKPEHPKDNYVIGKYPFLKQDAQQWSAWGIDYLKYDWFPPKTEEIKAMKEVLDAQPRDFLYSLSNRLSFDQAADYPKYANAWRISSDIFDSWNSVKKIGFNRDAWETAPLGNDKWEPYVGPGHFADPDMLVVGQVGWSRPRPTHLTPDEQYSHISLWCLLSAPLILGCDMTKLDDFTLGLLTNDEVLAVDQDSLGRMALRKGGTDQQPVYAKPLDDGSWAVGFFNLDEKPADVTVQWKDLDIAGRQTVRDLWRQKDLGTFDGSFTAKNVAPHGVVLARIFPVKTESSD